MTHGSHEIDERGYAILPHVFSGTQVQVIRDELANALTQEGKASALAASTNVYAARNVLDFLPSAREVWRTPVLRDLLTDVLGSFGLVRGLFFDKPPGQTWNLPWHKDMTIAVRDNRLPSQVFAKPTTKTGVPHVEAPQWLLEQMLTLRIHLDPMTEENGPLLVLPGSHRTGKALTGIGGSPTPIYGDAGDVLAMRPLLSHCSHRSLDGTQMHRRILHLEFAGIEELPDGFAWRDFISAGTVPAESNQPPGAGGGEMRT